MKHCKCGDCKSKDKLELALMAIFLIGVSGIAVWNIWMLHNIGR